MLYLVGMQPMLFCDVCNHPIGGERIALYSAASGTNHFPRLHLCCGEACAAVQEERLTAKPVQRLDWPDVMKALTR